MNTFEASHRIQGKRPRFNPPDFRSLEPGLWSALSRLDQRLVLATQSTQEQYGAEVCDDPFRGLHLSIRDAAFLLAQEPGQPRFRLCTELACEDLTTDFPRLAWLRNTYNLDLTEIAILLVALAPEIDLRYEQLYAYLQNDVSRRRPSVDLILNLLCDSIASKLEGRAYFSLEAPLIRYSLIHLIPDSNQIQVAPLLAHYVYLDEQIIRLLIGPEGLDTRLASFCELIDPMISLDHYSFAEKQRDVLIQIAEDFSFASQPVHLYFQGYPGTKKQVAAEALAQATSLHLLQVDLSKILVSDMEFEKIIPILFRQAWLSNAVLYLDGMDSLSDTGHNTKRHILMGGAANSSGITIFSGIQNWVSDPELPLGVLTVTFAMPEFEARLFCWKASLSTRQLAVEEDDLREIANRFQLMPGQIDQAAAEISSYIRWCFEQNNNDVNRTGLQGELYRAARRQCGYELSKLTQKIDPHYTWDDIVLPDEAMRQLQEMCNWITYRQQVIYEWGFDQKLSLGKGVNALFAGPSGTGKTMAAEVIAHELELDLYKIDLSTVVSKYVGETEKNLDRIFVVAEDANAILFFDEADALFGKRSEVRDSHDRYANIEISYLLQKMEQYKGIAILATNLSQNLDEAFVRRMAFTIHFPFPDEVNRKRIWAGIWPVAIPLADDVNTDFLACQFKLSGGNIKNIALTASFLAAADGNVVTIAHLFQAIQREYQKLGKTLSEAELYGEMYATPNGMR